MNTTKTRRRRQKRRAGSKTLKRMNCNPIVKGKTVAGDSCFTPDVLKKLQKSYNTHHPENPVGGSRPQHIWIQLKDRLSKCTKEDCWLNVIDDAAERKKLDTLTFAPDHPQEWKRDPNSWLSNFDIFNVLHQYESEYQNFKIIGPTPIDFDTRSPEPNGKCVWEELCHFSVKGAMRSGKTKIAVIFNLSKSTEAGTHWVSLFVDLDDHFIFYFDSTGDEIPQEIDALVKRIQAQSAEEGTKLKYYDNRGISHQEGNTECGMYSLFFVITMLTGEIKENKLSTCRQKIAFFRGKRIPDEFVSRYRKQYFND